VEAIDEYPVQLRIAAVVAAAATAAAAAVAAVAVVSSVTGVTRSSSSSSEGYCNCVGSIRSCTLGCCCCCVAVVQQVCSTITQLMGPLM
jgi:hypothetical protein